MEPKRKTGLSEADKRWLKHLGEHLDKLIKEKGYSSPYQFWIEKAGDTLPRATINSILKGSNDARASTLRKLAKLLGVKPSKILDFD